MSIMQQFGGFDDSRVNLPGAETILKRDGRKQRRTHSGDEDSPTRLRIDTAIRWRGNPPETECFARAATESIASSPLNLMALGSWLKAAVSCLDPD